MSIISTISTMQQSLEMRKNVARLDGLRSQANNELVTGLKSDVYADSGYRGAQTLDLRLRMDRAESYSTANKLLAGKLEMMNTQLGTIRGEVQNFLASSVSLSGGNISTAINTDAIASLNAVFASLNTTYSGEFLFSGMDMGRMSVDSEAVLTGLSGVAAGADLNGVNAAIAQLDAWFGLNGASDPNGYEATVYTGSNDGLQTARLDDFTTLPFGVTAGDEAFRNVFKGLAMLADPALGQIEDAAAKQAWRDAAFQALERGISGLQYHESVMGNQQALLGRYSAEQDAQKQLYNNRVVDIEGVDSYEAATRLEMISTQLQASYQVTVKLQQLTLLNFL